MAGDSGNERCQRRRCQLCHTCCRAQKGEHAVVHSMCRAPLLLQCLHGPLSIQVLEAMAPLFDLVQPKAVLWAAFRQRLHDNLHIVVVQTSSAVDSAELVSFMRQHCHVDHFQVRMPGGNMCAGQYATVDCLRYAGQSSF